MRVPARVKLLTMLALPVLALPLLSGAGAGAGQSLRYADVSMPETLAGAQDAPPPPSAATLPPDQADRAYPVYMPMDGLRRPAVRLLVKCDASRAAGREVYAGRSVDDYGGRIEGGYELVYEALDGTGRPCVYPFAPLVPQVAGDLRGTQYILRSSIPGRRVTFRSGNEWASVGLHLYDIGQQRLHFEMRDVELDFPGAIQPIGAVYLEVFDGHRPGLFTAVIRRSKIYGGKNAIFLPSGQTMLYVEDSEIAGNVGTNSDQEHSTYINGTLVSHFVRSSWQGQRAWQNLASGHQIKDKAYLRIYENVTVSNRPVGSTPSAMPLVDISAFGFTWSNGLRLDRIAPAQAPREGLVDLRTELRYGAPENYPWSLLVDPAWRMPPTKAAIVGQALDKVYLSIFLNTTVQSYRTEPYAIALRPQGTHLAPDGVAMEGNSQTTLAQQRMVSMAFNTSGTLAQVYAPQGWTLVDPALPPQARWVTDRDAFIRHALGLIGR